MKHRVGVFLLAICMGLFCFGCSSPEKEAEAVLSRLEFSFNNCDVQGVIDCLDPKTQQIYEGATNLIDIVVFNKSGRDKNTQRLLQMGASLLSLAIDKVTGNGVPPLKIVVNSSQRLSDDKIRVNATFRYDYSEVEDDDAFAVTRDIDIVKVDGVWAIALYDMVFQTDTTPVNDGALK